MPLVIGGQFIDANNDAGDMVLIEEIHDETAGRCGWTVIR